MGDDEYDFGGSWGDYGGDSSSYAGDTSGGGSTSWQDYMPGGSQYLPPGAGYFQVGDQQPQGIYAPGTPGNYQYMDAGSYDTMRGAPPSPRTSGYGPSTSATDSIYGGMYSNLNPVSYNPRPQQQPSNMAGARSVAQQTPQMISLGKPDTDLYNRYKSLLMNPDFSNDPTYKFLYNQGLQSLNRNLAAQRQTLSGKSINDSLAYGSGMASKYMQDLLPQYQAGAREELNRFMGPAGLLPHYAASNNATISGSNNMVNNQEDRAMYRDMLAGDPSGGMNWGSGIGYGGAGSSYMTPPTPTVSPNAFTPRSLASYNGGSDLSDYADEMSYYG